MPAPLQPDAEPRTFLILGCGYTGNRVARRLAARGERVIATSRNPEQIRIPGVEPVHLDAGVPVTLAELARRLPVGISVLHSVPAGKVDGKLTEPTREILDALNEKTARLVYLSTTGVYGAQVDVDEHTPAQPRTPRERLRAEAERQVLAGPWSAMVLRPAAIYGPGRGIHISMIRGDFLLLGDGSNYVSRIHVDDLAALAEAALLSPHTGAWPVADVEPARSRDIARYCADLLGLPMPRSASAEELSETRRANRRVDGRAVCRLLQVPLKYESYRTGIPAALAEEAGGDFALQSRT